MKAKVKAKVFMVVLIMCSIFSTLYLEFHVVSSRNFTEDQVLVEAYMQDNFYLPDVTFFKELFRSIFNVVRA
ncbi:MAG: hypothetical protein IPL08_21310 [Saprospiraceae bacterium]|nr:hypothetical protein [Saprospiraceae bacterium]